MKSIFDKVKGLFRLPKIPGLPMPSFLILSGVPRRAGLSVDLIAERIIQRKKEAGLPVGALDDGQPNPDEIMLRITVEEIIRALEQEAVIEVAIAPGDISVGAGANAGGPVQVTSTTTTIGKGYAIIR